MEKEYKIELILTALFSLIILSILIFTFLDLTTETQTSPTAAFTLNLPFRCGDNICTVIENDKDSIFYCPSDCKTQNKIGQIFLSCPPCHSYDSSLGTCFKTGNECGAKCCGLTQSCCGLICCNQNQECGNAGNLNSSFCCPVGYSKCSDSVASIPNYCCPPNTTCNGGTCKPKCPPGEEECGSGCCTAGDCQLDSKGNEKCCSSILCNDKCCASGNCGWGMVCNSGFCVSSQTLGRDPQCNPIDSCQTDDHCGCPSGEVMCNGSCCNGTCEAQKFCTTINGQNVCLPNTFSVCNPTHLCDTSSDCGPCGPNETQCEDGSCCSGSCGLEKNCFNGSCIFSNTTVCNPNNTCSSTQDCTCPSGNYDCFGVCNGSAIYDCAGICGGNATVDCLGVCNGNAVYDCEGDCDGGKIYDCDGICGGTTPRDVCGVCNGAETDITKCTCPSGIYDCANECDGTKEYGCDDICDSGKIRDVCGVCDGGETNINNCSPNPDCPSGIYDCKGTCDGDATNDCLEECDGSAFICGEECCDSGSGCGFELTCNYTTEECVESEFPVCNPRIDCTENSECIPPTCETNEFLCNGSCCNGICDYEYDCDYSKGLCTTFGNLVCNPLNNCNSDSECKPKNETCGNGLIEYEEECGEPGLNECPWYAPNCINCNCYPDNYIIDPPERQPGTYNSILDFKGSYENGKLILYTQCLLTDTGELKIPSIDYTSNLGCWNTYKIVKNEELELENGIIELNFKIDEPCGVCEKTIYINIRDSLETVSIPDFNFVFIFLILISIISIIKFEKK